MSDLGQDHAHPILSVRDLVKRFPVQRSRNRRRGQIHAVDGLDFDVFAGETVGLVGESGCGKSTAARAVLRLVRPTSGSVRFDGTEVTTMDRAALTAFRGRAQLVFQDAAGALNPRLSAGAMLAEVFAVHGVDGRRAHERTVQLLEQVGLDAADLERHPHEFSGGQRQRLGIARALAVEPELLILDEPVSALDVSVRAQVVNLLQDLRERLGLTYVFIAHDLTLVRHLCDRVVVMYAGRALEVVAARDIARAALHPYTRALLEAVPRVDGSRRGRGRSGRPAPLAREVDKGSGGCPWAGRCTHPGKDDSCSRVLPLMKGVSPGHRVACHKVAPGPESRP